MRRKDRRRPWPFVYCLSPASLLHRSILWTLPILNRRSANASTGQWLKTWRPHWFLSPLSIASVKPTSLKSRQALSRWSVRSKRFRRTVHSLLDSELEANPDAIAIPQESVPEQKPEITSQAAGPRSVPAPV